MLRLDVEMSDVPQITGQILPGPVAAELEPEVLRTIETFYELALEDLGVAGAFNVVDPRIVGYLTELGATRIRGINTTTQTSIATELAKGVQAGEGSRALARRVEKVFDNADKVRARRIARTEVNMASNFARHTAFDDSGIVRRKEWSAVRDTRTRRTHLRLDGQTRSLKKPFRIPGTADFAMYPGGFSKVGENVNCRCVVLPVVQRVSTQDAETYKPTAAMAANARRALEVREKKPPSQRGMTAVGLARARQLINRESLSLETVQRMVSYFARHEVDKQGSTWGEKGKGWQAWQGWGGDEGRAWANRIVAQVKRRQARGDEDVVDVNPEFDAAWEAAALDVERGMQRAFETQRRAVLAALRQAG